MLLKFDKNLGSAILIPSCRQIEEDISHLLEEKFCFIGRAIQRVVLDWLPSDLKHHTEACGNPEQANVIQSSIFPEKQQLYIAKLKEKIAEHLEHNLIAPQSVLREINSISDVLSLDVNKYAKYLKNDVKDTRGFKEEIKRLQMAKDKVEYLFFENNLQLGPILLQCQTFNERASEKIRELQAKLMKRVQKSIHSHSSNISAEVQRICGVLNNKNIKDIERLCRLKQFVKEIPVEIQKIKLTIREIRELFDLLEDNLFILTKEEIQKVWMPLTEQTKIFEDAGECVEFIEAKEKDFFFQLGLKNVELLKDIEECNVAFDIIQSFDKMQAFENAAQRCDFLDKQLDDCTAWAELQNSREVLFEVRLTDFSEIDAIRQKFQPFKRLWLLARNYFFKIDQWTKGPLIELERDQITQEVVEASKTLLNLSKQQFQDRRDVIAVVNDLRKLFDNFRPYLPLIFSLRCPFLKPRHWNSIQRLKDPFLDIDSDLHQSLDDIVANGAMTLVEQISEISYIAVKERKLEEQVAKMKDEWRQTKFKLLQHKDSATYLLHKPEPIWELLDEHILKTIAIANSPFMKFLQSEVVFWKSTLLRVQEVLEEWGRLQRGWLYLQPIFTSPDIQQQLPAVAASFLNVDKIWRSTMQNTVVNPLVLDVCLQSRLMETFQTCNEILEKVQQGLSEYLAKIRLEFPRFFFLPNEDLVSILSQAQEVEQIQPFLNKIFEGIGRLMIEESDGQVQGMFSQAGEYIQFKSYVQTREYIQGSNRLEVKRVEKWLLEVQEEMKQSLRHQFDLSQKDFGATDKWEWYLKWPAQVVAALYQCQWTQSMEGSFVMFQTTDKAALQKAFNIQTGLLRELVASTMNMPSEERHIETIGALIVIGVHQRDIAAEISDNNVSDVQDFQWIQHLRQYVLFESSPKGGLSQLEIDVKMVISSRRYGFEYQGNQPRLVITPLTDRCFRTLMQALQYNLGGAPEGPAGTGKTETTKDLAKVLAKQCLVFNCSKQLEYETMGKFFMGLACCGSWACFDEFNRIELEVLSVIASQILQIQTALMRRRPRAPFQFEGEALMLEPTCAIFITMNPGYAGRSELPDNLKSLFRPVAMMVANYSMIAEISLYSFGFQQARELSIKLTMCLMLASEQLSTQTHYDYGMRALKSIILAVGVRKKEDQNGDEIQIVYRSIQESTLPKLLPEDLTIFSTILTNLFPGFQMKQVDNTNLMKSISEACRWNSLELTPYFNEKIIQLNSTFEVRHGLMLVGATMSGKTELVRTLAQALSINYSDRKTQIHKINPKSISIGQLYGDSDPLTHEWSDGILARIVRESSEDKNQNRRHWIVMDGPVDAVWVENLNTVLDDNKKLCLPSGEMVKFTPQMSMVFEVEDLFQASPATVSRCGMVYLSSSGLPWNVQKIKYISNLPKFLIQDWRESLMSSLIDNTFPSLLDWALSQEVPQPRLIHQDIQASQIVQQFYQIFESFLLKNETRESLERKEREENEKNLEKQESMKINSGYNSYESPDGKWTQQRETGLRKIDIMQQKSEMSEMTNIFIMASVWAFGSLLTQQNSKSELCSLITSTVTSIPYLVAILDAKDLNLPKEGNFTLFDYYFDPSKGRWVKWLEGFQTLNENDNDLNEGQEEFLSGSNLQLQDINDREATSQVQLLIPTEDSIRYKFLALQLIRQQRSVCLLGTTGAGKTSFMKSVLQSAQHSQKWSMCQFTLSATTTTAVLQDFIEKNLEKQRKGVYGPRIQGKKLLFFIDDAGMTAQEAYGAQPPLELIRSFVSEKTLYDLKNTSLKEIIGVVTVGAMSLPQGGRKFPSSRILRQFNLFCLPELSTDTMQYVFQTILEKGFKRIDPSLIQAAEKFARVSISLFQLVRQNFLPTPIKCHYQFNVRQVQELIQSLQMVPLNIFQKLTNKQQLLQKLFVHESRRVFQDRLMNESDQIMAESLLGRAFSENFGENQFLNLDSPQMNRENLIFCNFARSNSVGYQLVEDIENVKANLQEIIQNYNVTKNKNKLLGIQLFSYMIMHLCRISRILLKPQGHGLLVTMGGNGRLTLIKLSSFINDCILFDINIKKSYRKADWQDDMKVLFKNSGIDDKPHVLVLNTKELSQCQGALDDICSIANSGEIANLFSQEDLDDIFIELTKQAQLLSQPKALASFHERCKRNVHILLSISPNGDQFREFLRLYPALVNCMTFNWFFQWPEDALKSVAIQTLKQCTYLNEKILTQNVDSQSKQENQGDRRSEIVSLFVNIYQSVVLAGEKYEKEKGVLVYITPQRFVQSLFRFESLLSEKAQATYKETDDYLYGVKKLEDCNKDIDLMQESIEKLKPELQAQEKDIEVGMKHLEQETQDIEDIQKNMEVEAEYIKQQQQQAGAIKEECLQRLLDVQPLFDQAVDALQTLKVSDFQQMRSYLQPHQGIRLALEAACIMLGEKPKIVDVRDSKTGKSVKTTDYWDKSKKLLGDYKKLLGRMTNYNKDDIPDEICEAIQVYLTNPEFVPEKIRKASEAAEGICKWVRAVCSYYVIAKEIEPKRRALKIAEQNLELTEKQFKVKQDQLNSIFQKRDLLAQQQNDKQQDRKRLINVQNSFISKLKLAKLLLESLAHEKERWEQRAQTLQEGQKNLIGNIALAACSITYLGPFDGVARHELVQVHWQDVIHSVQEISASINFDLKESVGDYEKIQKWHLQGLPVDKVSCENMIILEELEDHYWPLILDPQEQAIIFIKEYLNNQYILTKASNDNLKKVLVYGLKIGASIVCQNVGELEGTQTLLSLINKQVMIVEGQRYIQIEDNQYEYNKNFRLILISSNSNPKISPSIQSKVQILNFQVAQEGLQEQLLSIVCKNECAKEEEEKYRLHKQNILFESQRKDLEYTILKLLREQSEEILESENLLNFLQDSRKLNDDITKKLISAKNLTEKIEEARKTYRPVAVQCAKLFFLILNLQKLDHMYNFSLKWFKELLQESLQVPSSMVRERIPRQRVTQIKKRFKKLMHEKVSMSLLTHHQLTFAFLMAININEQIEGAQANIKEANITQKLKNIEGSVPLKSQGESQKSSVSKVKFQVPVSKVPESNVKGNKSDNTKDQQTQSNLPSKVAIKQSSRNPNGDHLSVPSDQFKYLLTGLLQIGQEIEVDRQIPDQCLHFIDRNKWRQILELATFPCFDALPTEFEKNPREWQSFIELQISNSQSNQLKIPEPFSQDQLPCFSAILLLKVLKPELAINQIKKYVELALGSEFTRAAQWSLRDIYDNNSKPSTPILLLLTPGNDPIENIQKLAEIKQKIPYQVSLGKGQQQKAVSLLTEVRQYGGWVVLQNCHLAPSFMPELAQIVDGLQPTVQAVNLTIAGENSHHKEDIQGDKKLKPPHSEFRLWLVSMSCDFFDSQILQASIKLTSEPPQGVRSSLERIFKQTSNSKPDRDFYESSNKPRVWNPLFLSLTFFHSVICERKKFGAIGWNTSYDFNDSDFRISMRQLHSMVQTYDNLPFKALNYLIGECNYGGRVNDDHDRRTLVTILQNFFQDQVLVDSNSDDGYKFIKSSEPMLKQFRIQSFDNIDSYLSLIEEIPHETSPLVVGLHPNTNINLAILQMNSIKEQVLRTSGQRMGEQSGGSDASYLQGRIQLVQDMIVQVRQPFEMSQIRDKFPIIYTQSTNLVLIQEVQRYNTLLGVIHSSLQALLSELKGEAVSTADADALFTSITNNQVPVQWSSRAYPSLKALSYWIMDLGERLRMFDDWIDAGKKPEVLWLSSLYFPQSFLTAAKQDYARAYNYPIDRVHLDAGIIPQENFEKMKDSGSVGCHLVQGLNLHGAKWCSSEQRLEEQDPGVTQYVLPYMQLKPYIGEDQPRHAQDVKSASLYRRQTANLYTCPVYRTSKRAGTLSTTGHSTNFVMDIELPSTEPAAHWIQRGTAIVLAKDE